jgi:hypothetical protein
MGEGLTVGSGKVFCGSDFMGGYSTGAWAATVTIPLPGGLFLYSVNEGSMTPTTDESSGVIGITTDTGDDDNAAIVGGLLAPRDGKMVLRARFKYSNVDCAIWVGFAETMVIDTPVMPSEFATATMTYNPGGQVGFNYDVDGTTDDFRAVMGDGSAAVSDSGNGIRANATLTADRWFEAEVIVNEDGTAECWFGDVGHQNSDSTRNRLRLIKRFTTGTLITPTDVFHGVLMIENRSGNARVLEVDYFYVEGGRDFRAT